MTSGEIKKYAERFHEEGPTDGDNTLAYWEIAYQLAVMNERKQPVKDDDPQRTRVHKDSEMSRPEVCGALVPLRPPGTVCYLLKGHYGDHIGH